MRKHPQGRHTVGWPTSPGFIVANQTRYDFGPGSQRIPSTSSSGSSKGSGKSPRKKKKLSGAPGPDLTVCPSGPPSRRAEFPRDSVDSGRSANAPRVWHNEEEDNRTELGDAEEEDGDDEADEADGEEDEEDEEEREEDEEEEEDDDDDEDDAPNSKVNIQTSPEGRTDSDSEASSSDEEEDSITVLREDSGLLRHAVQTAKKCSNEPITNTAFLEKVAISEDDHQRCWALRRLAETGRLSPEGMEELLKMFEADLLREESVMNAVGGVLSRTHGNIEKLETNEFGRLQNRFGG